LVCGYKKYSDKIKRRTKKSKTEDAVKNRFGKSKGEIGNLLYGLPLLVVPWVLLEKLLVVLIMQFKTKTFICYDFKIWWCKNDGSCLFFNAISKNISKLAQLADAGLYFTLYRSYNW
jgi:hypothetical protein